MRLYYKNKKSNGNGFTIIELIVVIMVVGILSAITAVSYGNWKNSTDKSKIKSDLNGAVAAMSDYRNFKDAYPSAIPSSFNPSENINISVGISGGEYYCLNAYDSGNPSLNYYIESTDTSEAKIGVCFDNGCKITIKIGNQIWCSKNLNEGALVSAPTLMVGSNSIKEKYCYDNDESMCVQYGGLYTWDEAMQAPSGGPQGICPSGFIIPSDDDWKVMESYLGMPVDQVDIFGWSRGNAEGVGTKLKVGGSSGFDAKLGGFYWSGSFSFLGGSGGYWTSTNAGTMWSGPINRIIENPAAYVGRFENDAGFDGYRSIRCIKP